MSDILLVVIGVVVLVVIFKWQELYEIYIRITNNSNNKMASGADGSYYGFQPSQYEYRPETQLKQETNFVRSGLDRKETDLLNLQLVFLIDISGSMEETDVDPEGVGKDGLLGRGKWTRFDNMVKILRNMTSELLKFDKDGKLPCFFFNNAVSKIEITDPNVLIAQVRRYKPGGSTAMHLALYEAIQEVNDIDNYLFVVFTDGVPDDTNAVSRFLQNEIHRRDPKGDRLNVLFLRFGDDSGAIKFLEDMDDHSVFGENVDTKSDNAAFVLGPKLLVLNAIYEEIEKKPEWQSVLDACK